MLDIRSRFHAEMVEDIHEVAERHGYDLVLSAATRSRSEQRAVETLIDSRCEALVLLGPELPTARLAELDRQLPVVVVGRRLPSATVDVVRVPDDEGVARAVAHLVELGHREIVYVDGGPGSIGADRRRGYQQAMRTHRLRDTARVVPGGRTEEAGSAAARELLDGAALPTAIVAFNDRCAVGLLDVLARNGVDVPGEVSVVGYDDDPLARMRHVSLTSVGQDSAALTERALEAVVERLDGGRTGHREVVIAPYLAVRATTGPVRPAGSA
jgi:DNA-binding LacI/PurR family transcriptional regulator